MWKRGEISFFSHMNIQSTISKFSVASCFYQPGPKKTRASLKVFDHVGNCQSYIIEFVPCFSEDKESARFSSLSSHYHYANWSRCRAILPNGSPAIRTIRDNSKTWKLSLSENNHSLANIMDFLHEPKNLSS